MYPDTLVLAVNTSDSDMAAAVAALGTTYNYCDHIYNYDTRYPLVRFWVESRRIKAIRRELQWHNPVSDLHRFQQTWNS